MLFFLNAKERRNSIRSRRVVRRFGPRRGWGPAAAAGGARATATPPPPPAAAARASRRCRAVLALAVKKNACKIAAKKLPELQPTAWRGALWDQAGAAGANAFSLWVFRVRRSVMRQFRGAVKSEVIQGRSWANAGSVGL